MACPAMNYSDQVQMPEGFYQQQPDAADYARQPLYRPYDPYASTLPLATFTSGMLPSGMNYDRLPAGTEVQGFGQPTVSPLQQWFQTHSTQHRAPTGYEVGQPVRICHLTAPECVRYNGLVGDILAVHNVEREDFSNDMLFDVRCLVEGASLRAHNQIGEGIYANMTSSDFSQRAAGSNRAQLAPMFGMMANVEAEDESAMPPFVILSRLPSEKLEPLATMSGAPTSTTRVNALPPQVRPPIWGKPLDPVNGGTNQPIPERMSKLYQMSLDAARPQPQQPVSSMPPTNPLASGGPRPGFA